MMPIDVQTSNQSGAALTQRAAPRVDPTRILHAVGSSGATQDSSPTSDAIVSAARQIESYLQRSDSSLEFQIDSATGQTVVTVRNTATGDVVRQIPNEEVLRIAQRIDAENSAVLNLHV